MTGRIPELDPHSITDVVVATLEDARDARLREVMTSLVRHLHAFAREVDLTPAELMAGIQFLTESGRMCTPDRQELVMLSDTLGLSSLVGILAAPAVPGVTRPSVLGPFYRADPPEFGYDESIASGVEGEVLVIRGRVAAPDGTPIVEATVDVWHSSPTGFYDVQDPALGEVNLRGRTLTNEAGEFRLRSIVPTGYPLPDDGTVARMLAALGRHGHRPAHVHFVIAADGFCPLTTCLFDEADPEIAEDTVFGVDATLAVPWTRDPADPGLRHLCYDFVLAPEDRG